MITNTYGGQAGDMNFPDNQVEMYPTDIQGLVVKVATYPNILELFGNDENKLKNGLLAMFALLNKSDERGDEKSLLTKMIQIFTIARCKSIVTVDDYTKAICGSIEVDSTVYKDLKNLLEVVLALNHDDFEAFKQALRSTVDILLVDIRELRQVRNIIEKDDASEVEA